MNLTSRKSPEYLVYAEKLNVTFLCCMQPRLADSGLLGHTIYICSQSNIASKRNTESMPQSTHTGMFHAEQEKYTGSLSELEACSRFQRWNSFPKHRRP